MVHGTEFITSEEPIVETKAGLAKQYWAGAIQTDRQSNERQERGQKKKHQGADDEIEG
jgi:hypothetical protein